MRIFLLQRTTGQLCNLLREISTALLHATPLQSVVDLIFSTLYEQLGGAVEAGRFVVKPMEGPSLGGVTTLQGGFIAQVPGKFVQGRLVVSHRSCLEANFLLRGQLSGEGGEVGHEPGPSGVDIFGIKGIRLEDVVEEGSRLVFVQALAAAALRSSLRVGSTLHSPDKVELEVFLVLLGGIPAEFQDTADHVTLVKGGILL